MRVWFWGIGIAAAALIGGLLLRGSGPPPGADRPPCNVVLISIDTLRADHLGCYGHPAAVTPNIDRLAAEGVLFEQCTAAAPLTLPSHATMLTGTQPYVHGARDNGHFHLHDDNVTLPEVLRDAGYRTLAEVAAYVLNHEYGIAQGFDTYHDVATGPDQVGIAERRGDEVCESALRLLDEQGTEPFFLFVHLYDPHFPYAAPAETARRFDDPYLAEIAFADAQIGRLLDGLAARGHDRDTLVVLVSDHGESLGEHGERTHGVHVYDATMAVPMIWWCPERLPAGRRVPGQVRLADIAPTVLAFLGQPALADAEGVSLLPLLRGAVTDDDRVAYSESMMPYHNWGYAPPRAIRKGGWKYIHAASPQLFDLRSDPGEQRNLAAGEPERVASMQAVLERLIGDAPTVVDPHAATRDASAADIERLQALGYAGGDDFDAAAHSELELLELVATLPDTHTNTAEIDRMQSALRQIILQDYPAAARELQEILDLRGPAAQIPWVHGNLGLALGRLGRHEEALPHYRRALELQPDNGSTLTNYALSLIELARYADAEAALQRAVEVPPVLATTHEAYGLTLHRLQRTDEAIARFRTALEVSPGSAHIVARLARVLLEADRPDEADALLVDALAEQPEHIGLSELRADVLRRAGRASEARAVLRRIVERDPARDRTWHALAFGHLAAGEWQPAADALQAALDVASDNARYANDLAWLLATCPDAAIRDGAAALRLAERAGALRGGADANILDTQAAALAEMGRYAEAVAIVDRALTLAAEAGADDLVAALRSRRALYQQEAPYRLGH